MYDSAHPFGRKKRADVTIIPDLCTGCGYCPQFCIMDCIIQRPDGLYEIVQEDCIGCRACKVNCPFDAITAVEKR
ncbi:MAG: ferredoxin [Ruminococcaceae bacterium]|nr:ferredoxin [Oscillospiraceae bacterium]